MSAPPPPPDDRGDGRPSVTEPPRVLPQAVLERLPRREPAALEAFFDAYFDRVYGYVRRLVGDDHLAEDLTQEIFLHVHRALDTYDPARDVRPWVFTIATNKVRDHWRSRRHREAGREDVLDAGLADSDEALSVLELPEARLGAAEVEERVRAAIEALPEGMRATVLLRVYEELSFDEIGAVLGSNEVAVRKRFSRALEALRQALAPIWREGT